MAPPVDPERQAPTARPPARIPGTPSLDAVNFALERESPRTWALRLVPLSLPDLLAALPRGPEDRYLLLPTAGPEPEPPVPGPVLGAGELACLRPPLEAVHLRRAPRLEEVEALPSPILLCPDRAVPRELGSRCAFSIQDCCHGVLYSTDLDLLRGVLRAFLQRYQLEVLGQRDTRLPELPDSLLEPLLVPMGPAEYRQVRFEPREHYWLLSFEHREAGVPVPLAPELRWVSRGEGDAWRAGWSW